MTNYLKEMLDDAGEYIPELPHVERMRIKRERKSTDKERDLDRRSKRQDKHSQRY